MSWLYRIIRILNLKAEVDSLLKYAMRSPSVFGSLVTRYIANRAGSSVVTTWAVSIGAAEATNAIAATVREDIMNFIFRDEGGGPTAGLMKWIED